MELDTATQQDDTCDHKEKGLGGEVVVANKFTTLLILYQTGYKFIRKVTSLLFGKMPWLLRDPVGSSQHLSPRKRQFDLI
jgi:hypothetical protein